MPDAAHSAAESVRDDLEDTITEWEKDDPQIRERIEAALQRRTAESVVCPNSSDLGHKLSYDSGWHCTRCPAVLHLSVWYQNEDTYRAARTDGLER